jgi:hypothetical protein
MNPGFNTNIALQGIVVIVGHFGSGKTEIAINLALQQGAKQKVRLADLDLVNPYFRTREARVMLASQGVEVVLPPEIYMHADLPILSPNVAGMLRNASGLTLLDVGGDDVGATVLAALHDVLNNHSTQMLMVVNACRPYTANVEGCLRMRDEIEKASRLQVSGLISNSHLIDETEPDDVYRGCNLVAQMAAHSGIPVAFATVRRVLMAQLDPKRIDCPVLLIDRHLRLPWQQAAAASSDIALAP